MKVILQTRLTPPITVYDGSESSGAGKAIKDFLNPVVAVTDDDGNGIYQTGDFHEASWLPLIAGVVGFVIVSIIVIRRI